MAELMKILLSNDDGVFARGLNELYVELRKLGTVKVFAPLEEMSATGHSLSLHRPLRIHPIKKDFFGVNGSPADCIYLGMHEAFKGGPDIVVSGINRGGNLGQDIFYSGTVSAAREACSKGIPSFAVSLNIEFGSKNPDSKNHYPTAAKMAKTIIQSFVKKKLPNNTLLNINVPNLPLKKVKGVRPTQQGLQNYDLAVIERKDHRGKSYYWVDRRNTGHHPDPLTDCDVTRSGFVSITPMKLDSTDFTYLDQMDSRLLTE